MRGCRENRLCKRRTEFQNAEEERGFNDLLEAERTYAEDSPAIEPAKRGHDMLMRCNEVNVENLEKLERDRLRGPAPTKPEGFFVCAHSG